MAPFSKLSGSVFLAVLFSAELASAFNHYRPDTHRRHMLKRGLEIEVYHPKTSFETFPKGTAQPATGGDGQAFTTAFVAEQLGIDSTDIAFANSRLTKGIESAYVKQSHNNIPVANAVANIVSKGQKVLAFGSSFVETAAATAVASSEPTLTKEKAISIAETTLELTYNGQPISLEYVARPDGSLVLTYVVQVRNTSGSKFMEAFVDAHSGDVVSLTDFVAHYTYAVTPSHHIDPTQGRVVTVDPEDLVASPLGWHDTGSGPSSDTSGNNVVTFTGREFEGNKTKMSSEGTFNYPFDPKKEPWESPNNDAARVNLFYILNKVHDIAYRYGFTEEAHNFQSNNFGKGGAGGDRVKASAQDASGMNNAFFATPPDGQHPLCAMFIFDLTKPNRDGSLVNDIPVHEFTHGITNRMTGGGSGRCLQTHEAGGMGEGWSDALADWMQAKADFGDFASGEYVLNNKGGIRAYPYSVNRKTNPLMYGDGARMTSGHEVGTIWATILHGVLGALIEKHGFSDTAATNPEGPEGNIVWLHLFMDGLAIQPCNPTFATARDAWIQADENRYGGTNACLLWKEFAGRGVGIGAEQFKNSRAVPQECAFY